MHGRYWSYAIAALVVAVPGALSAQDSGVTLRILAYNIRHGAGMDDRIDLARAAAVINRLEPDLVALQEIDSATTRTDRVDQAQRLGELTGMMAVFGGFMPYRDGQYGMALLSRYPIVDATNHRLPDGREPRTTLAATVDIEGTRVVIAGIHLYATADERLSQAHRVTAIFRDSPDPVVLVGDFNSGPDSPVLAHLAETWWIPRKGDDRLTFPSDAADREIDYIMLRPRGRFELIDYDVIDEPLASDHRPVLMVVRLSKEPHP